MRVITGTYRGRTINTVKGLSVRPATDRVRQTIYDILATRLQFDGARVLDLFAGSGSLGLEAISRGAAWVTFVDQDREAAACIRQNLQTLGCASSAEVVEMDAMSFVRLDRGPFELVFADPPYAFGESPDIPSLVFSGGLVRPGGFLVMEHGQRVQFRGTPEYHVGPEKRFGRTLVTFFQPIITRTTRS
jgi:16S rRNA (guanine966-N2)-methyltransferase